jgi:predicted SnoaL-like aldol condensation-catalyzing enzyme
MADLKDLSRRFYKEVFENHNLDAIDELVTQDAIEHDTPPPGVEMKPGREGVKALCKAYLDGFKPISVQVNDQYQDGDTVISRITYTATNSGQFAGIPATDKQVTVDSIDIVRFSGDKAAEHWSQFDALGMLTQLGVVPAMG